MRHLILCFTLYSFIPRTSGLPTQIRLQLPQERPYLVLAVYQCLWCLSVYSAHATLGSCGSSATQTYQYDVLVVMINCGAMETVSISFASAETSEEKIPCSSFSNCPVISPSYAARSTRVMDMPFVLFQSIRQTFSPVSCQTRRHQADVQSVFLPDMTTPGRHSVRFPARHEGTRQTFSPVSCQT